MNSGGCAGALHSARIMGDGSELSSEAMSLYRPKAKED
jgi:hypothetical protein